VYVPTYMPPVTAPYAMNFSCAKADGSRGTCAPSFLLRTHCCQHGAGVHWGPGRARHGSGPRRT
jgi:hypothetical protein